MTVVALVQQLTVQRDEHQKDLIKIERALTKDSLHMRDGGLIRCGQENMFRPATNDFTSHPDVSNVVFSDGLHLVDIL